MVKEFNSSEVRLRKPAQPIYHWVADRPRLPICQVLSDLALLSSQGCQYPIK